MIGTPGAVAGFSTVPWKLFRNLNSETCPVGGVLRIVSCILVDGEIVARCDKPNDDPQAIYLVNTGPIAVPTYSDAKPFQGTCAPLTHHGGIVLIDGSISTPAMFDFWGPQDGQWHLTNSTSLGRFLILSDKESDPDRVVAMQVSVAGPKRALATLQGTLLACNHTPGGLTALPAGHMPSGLARLRYSALDGADVQFDVASDPETIYNPTPFSYANGDVVWLVRADGHWLVERAAYWKPCAEFSIVPRVYSPGGSIVFADLTTDVNLGGVATLVASSPGEVRITCPATANMPYRVSWGANIIHTTASIATLQCTFGPTGLAFPQDVHLDATRNFGIANSSQMSFSGSRILQLSMGQVFTLKSETVCGITTAKNLFSGYLSIEPLF